MRAFGAAINRAMDLAHFRDAWAELFGRVGPDRAAWIGELALRNVKPGLRPGRFSRPAYARLLPDRWVALVELDDGSTRVAWAAAPVLTPLETSPASGGVDWMTDFAEAERAGMALRVDLPAAMTEIRRLVVTGARGTFDPVTTKGELERLLDAHHYTRGLELLAPGTPTNSIPGTRAGYSSQPEFEDAWRLEGRRQRFGGTSLPLSVRGDRSDGTGLAETLGIDPATFAYVRRADGSRLEDGRHLRSVFRAAFERRLTLLLDGILPAAALDEALGFAVEAVNPLGPTPAFRVGRQPYGVLPLLLRRGQPPLPGSIAADLLPVLERLRANLWLPAVAQIDRVGKPGADPGPTLVRILQQDAVARTIAFRPLYGPQLAGTLVAQLGRGSSATLDADREVAAQLLDGLGAPDPRASPLLAVLNLPFAPALLAPVVEPPDAEPTSAQRATNYLELVATHRLDRLAHNDYDGERPRSLLFAIARLAMLELADAAAREAFIAAGFDPSRWDDEEVPSVYLDGYGTPLRRFEAPDPTDPLAPVWFHLSEAGRDSTRLSGIRRSLRVLKTREPELLEEMTRSALGLFSHRLDAWYTALAGAQLRELRSNPPTDVGVNVGAYGILEHISVAPRQRKGTTDVFTDPTNGGFIHAPSANHGAAAAVLRSVHLAHAAAGHRDAFSIDLSSARVRRALELLEGIRAGQPLGALIGYAIERELVAAKLGRFVALFRGAAPLVAHRLTTGTEPVDAVAASNVVDGLVLLERAGYDGVAPATVGTLWAAANLRPAPDAPTTAELQLVLATAQDAIDAVADLVMAESVYQAVQGNSLRSGAAADSVAGAPVSATEPDVVRTPRTGVATTQRVLLLLSSPQSGDERDWAATPRALAEPRLDAWARLSLPTTARLRIRATILDGSGEEIDSVDTTLADLHEAARDTGHLRVGALDVVFAGEPHETPQRTSLEVRLVALIAAGRNGKGEVQLVFERSEAWTDADFGIVETLEIARSLREVIGHARALAATDLSRPTEAAAVSVDTTDLADREAAAAQELGRVGGLLANARGAKDAPSLREALFAAEALGVAGAAPTSLADSGDAATQARLVKGLVAQADAAAKELPRRTGRVAEIGIDDPVGRLEAMFGEGFRVLPLLGPAGDVTSMFGNPPDGATSDAARTWLAQAARVREGVRLLDGALAYADAVAEMTQKRDSPALHVAQLPFIPKERWVALPTPAGDMIPGGRISIVAASPGEAVEADPVAGLLVDEWVEVVPTAEETTSVAFHFDAPSSTAPHTMLLVVPPLGLETWTAELARQAVDEALELAQLRLVDPDALPAIGQVLPALFAAESAAGEAIGLDVEFLTRPVA